MSEEVKIRLVEVDVNKISLKPGDVLFVKVKGPDFQNDEVCESLAETLRKAFPNNKVGVLYLQENQVDMSVISQETAQALEKVLSDEKSACNPVKTCDNCKCGNKANTEEVIATAEKVMEENKELFQDLAKLEEQEKLTKEENGNESN